MWYLNINFDPKIILCPNRIRKHKRIRKHTTYLLGESFFFFFFFFFEIVGVGLNNIVKHSGRTFATRFTIFFTIVNVVSIY
jgi:hypothetical protein